MKDSSRPPMAAVKRDISTRFTTRGEDCGVETTKEPTVSWAEIAVSGNSSPNSVGGVMEKEFPLRVHL